MLRKLHDRDEGFTLIEILVVILIIGVLAAIALPTFLGQQDKGKDASAKADARNAVSQMESCNAETQTFVTCPNANTPFPSANVVVASSPAATATTYKVTATSKTGTTFSIEKLANGSYKRTCSPTGTGGCPSTGATSW